MRVKVKRIMAVLLCIVGVLSMIGCAGPVKKDKLPYKVKIEKVFICGSRNGDLLVVNLEVTNQSKEYIKGSTVSYKVEAKMDGAALNSGYMAEENPNLINQEESIESGKTGKAQLIYELGDKKKGEVALLGVGNAEGSGKQVEFLKETVDLEKAERIVSESDYELTIDNVVATDDGEGANLVVIDMTFTNNGEEATSFGSAIKLEIFQNGVALKSGNLPYRHPSYNEEIESNSYLDIQKGASLSVREVFTLNDAGAPVQVKAVDEASFDQAALIEKEIQLQ